MACRPAGPVQCPFASLDRDLRQALDIFQRIGAAEAADVHAS